MSKKTSIKDILKNGGFFLSLIILTFYLLFRDKNILDIFKTITQVNFIYLVIAIGCMCIFVYCEAVNILRSLKIFGYTVNLLQCIKYALVGFFFSSVTPSASGGQPMQVYYMHKDKIDISHSTLALLIELASFQFITVTMAIISFITQFNLFNETIGEIKYLLFIGLTLNTLILTLILLTIFSKNTIPRLVNFIVNILHKIHFKKAEKFKIKATEQIEKYQLGAIYFRKNKQVIIKILLTSILQITALHSISFWVYRAFGFSEYSFVTIIAMQAVLFITVSSLPLPGAVGVSESGFLILYKTLFPIQVINSAMLLSRGISFYLFVLISGIGVMVLQFTHKHISVSS